VYKPKGITVKKEVYNTCFDNNKDGAGFIVREKTGELKLEKGFFTFKDFWEHFQPHLSKQAIIHFRIATHGEVDTENCHPLWVKENTLAFAHNGVINQVDCSKDKTRSDTWHFNATMLQHLREKMGEEFIFDEVIQSLITEYISWSKLAFLHADGRTLIFNKSKGDMENGVWFSNSTYKTWKKTYKTKFWKQKEQKEQMVNPSTVPIFPYNNLPVIPIRSLPPASETIRMNDYIEMIHSFNDITSGEVGLVMSIYADRTIEAKIYDSRSPTGWKIRNLPYGAFRIYKSDVQSKLDQQKSIEGKVVSKEVSSPEKGPTEEEKKQTAYYDNYESYLN